MSNNKAQARLGNKSYDDIIGSIVFSMLDLTDYIAINTPEKRDEMNKLYQDFFKLKNYIAEAKKS